MPKARVQTYASLDDLLSAAEPAWHVHPGEIFAAVPWYRNLLAHGFASPVQAAWLSVAGAGQAQPSMAVGLKRGADGWESLANYYSSLWAAIGEPRGLGPAGWSALGEALRALPAPVLRLQPLAEDGALLAGLEQGLRAAGYWTDRFFCFGNWYLRVQGRSAEAHFAERPSALRHSVERGRRRLARAGDWDLRIHCTADAALEPAIADFVSVYDRSWKTPEPCAGFMPGLIRTAAAQGWLRLGVLRLAGEPIAAQVWLVCGGKANIYKLAYVQGHERLSPGSVLTAALMAHAIDVDRVDEVDYLSGDDAYKRDWMGARRERVGLVAFQPGNWRGLLAAARHFGPRWLRRARRAA